ncbi:MAG: zinc ribbon domain-containing protein [Cyanobacteria bacterium P01_C01_bin.120]
MSVGFGMIGGMLDYKLAEASDFHLESPTRQLKPTQRCAVCWELTPKTLSDRIHVCQHYGHTEDRDTNAAQVNLIWAKGQELSLGRRATSSTNCGSMRQLAVSKRAKSLAEKTGNPALHKAG